MIAAAPHGGAGHRRLWPAVLVGLALLVAAPSADALIIRAPHGRHVGILPRVAATASMRALASRQAPARHRQRARPHTAHHSTAGPLARAAAASPADPLVYHSGGPVLGAHQTYTIYWDPSGQQPFPAGYETSIDQYLTDVGVDSGSHANVYSVAAQYGGNAVAGVYASSFGAAQIDTNAYPLDQTRGNAGGCTHGTAHPGDPAYTYCLTDAQIQTELKAVIANRGWPTGSGALYFVILPAGVDECMGAGVESANNQCADRDFCAYHDASGTAPTMASSDLYGVIPYQDISGCQSGQSPNGTGADTPADDTISIISHEHNEAITDPLLTSWYDIHGNENGDKCEFDFGSALGGTTPNQWNQVINAHHYFLQQEWSNAAMACVQSDLLAQFAIGASNGAASPRTYTLDASATTPAGAGASYAWAFGDGSSTTTSGPTVSHSYAQDGNYAATLTVTDTAGHTSSATRPVTVATPGAQFMVFPSPGYVGQGIDFDGSGSGSSGGTITSWTWSFGDGSSSFTSTGPTMTHFFTRAGSFPVTLTVHDTSGNVASATREVVINAPISVGQPPSAPPPSGAHGPTSPTIPGTSAIVPGAAVARLGSVQVVLSHGHLVLNTGRALTCPTGVGRCTVAVTVTTRVISASLAGGHRHTTVRTVALATAILTAAPGHRTVISMRLSSAGAALLRRLHRLSASLNLHAHATTGGAVTQALTTVLRLPHHA